MFDSRLKFLLGFLLVAIFVAAILTFVEIMLKRKKAVLVQKLSEESPVEKMRKKVLSNKSAREKLEIINGAAKKYFKQTFGTPLNSTYSALIENFEKNKEEKDLEFCKAMFDTYYSKGELTDQRIRLLANLLIIAAQQKEQTDQVVPVSFFGKVDKLFGSGKGSKKLVSKSKPVEKKVEKRKEVEEEHESLFSVFKKGGWIRKHHEDKKVKVATGHEDISKERERLEKELVEKMKKLELENEKLRKTRETREKILSVGNKRKIDVVVDKKIAKDYSREIKEKERAARAEAKRRRNLRARAAKEKSREARIAFEREKAMEINNPEMFNRREMDEERRARLMAVRVKRRKGLLGRLGFR